LSINPNHPSLVMWGIEDEIPCDSEYDPRGEGWSALQAIIESIVERDLVAGLSTLPAEFADKEVVGPHDLFEFELPCPRDAMPSLDEPLAVEFELREQGDVQSDEDEEIWEAYLTKTLTQILVGPARIIRESLTKFHYLGPLRETPSRHHRFSTVSDSSRWASGLGAWDALQNGSNELIQSVSGWLEDIEKLNAGYGIERKKFLELDLANPAVRKLYNRQAFDDVDEDQQIDLASLPISSRLVIVSTVSGADLRPSEVGVGISQVVPVIVTALDGQERLLAIEQPELHIHPRLQAEIADLFIEAIHKNKHRFILETHSEHLILRLLRRVRETEVNEAPNNRTLRTGDLAIYYLKQEEGSSRAVQIDVDVKGEFIQPWPDDFFEIDFYERFS
jgi:hypothetical protein